MSTNSISATGLTIQSQSDIISEILNGAAGFPGMYQIYGADINVDANSPDGQMINIVAQAKLDVLEFLQAIFNSFDPDEAIGVSLDARCAINGVVRNAGTYTQQIVQVTANQSLTLPGLDDYPSAPFTVSDSSGNLYQLLFTTNFGTAGTEPLEFQAELLGPVSSLPNTITTISTPTSGVTAVNNSGGPTTVGQAEETDAALRLRRQNSVALPSRGYFAGLYAALIDTAGVTQVLILENDTNATDGNGVPAHSFWCIVAGSATEAAIGNAIYVERPLGVGMKGSISVPITQVDGSTFNVLYDVPALETLWITLTVSALSGSLDPHYLNQQLQAQLAYGINETADITTIAVLVRQIYPEAVVSSAGVSLTNGSYASTVAPSTVQSQFNVNGTMSIVINGVVNP